MRPCKQTVRDQFTRFNIDHFGGVLPETPVHWRRMSAYGVCYEPCSDYPLGLIVLTTMEMPPCSWPGLLLHEMVHLYLDMWEVDEWEHGRIEYHGPRFVEECNRIADVLGLPQIDEDEGWSWPHAVHYTEIEPCKE